MHLTLYPATSPVAALVLAHGAGAGQTSPFMTQASKGLAERGVSVGTFDFPYMTARKRVPDPPQALETRWREAINAARNTFDGGALFIGGKSMGGRIASQVAAQGVDGLEGLVFLGYPLHPPGKPHQRRDAHLPRIVQPMLFVQGTRDPFGTVDEIRALAKSLDRAMVHEVVGGDHSFKIAGRGAPRPEVVLAEVMDVVADWIRNVVSVRSR